MIDLCFEVLCGEELARDGAFKTSVSDSPPASAVNPPIFKKPLRDTPSQNREEDEPNSVSIPESRSMVGLAVSVGVGHVSFC